MHVMGKVRHHVDFKLLLVIFFKKKSCSAESLYRLMVHFYVESHPYILLEKLQMPAKAPSKAGNIGLILNVACILINS